MFKYTCLNAISEEGTALFGEDFEKTEDKTVSMKVDKGVWEDFLRLCSNTSHDRKTLVTQALSDFMKVHKDLL